MTIAECPAHAASSQAASPAMFAPHGYMPAHSPVASCDVEGGWPNVYSNESLYSAYTACASPLPHSPSEGMSTLLSSASPAVMPVPVAHPAPLRDLRSKHWVKVQGLPFATTTDDLIRFFAKFRLAAPDHIFLVMSGGRTTGRAFVEFVDMEEAQRACAALNRTYLESRWLELRTVACRDVLRHLREVASMPDAQHSNSGIPAGVDPALRAPANFLPLPRTGNCLKLVGLPFGCTSEAITEFLQPYHVRPGGIHFCLRKGRPTGKCVVEMVDAIEVIKAVRTLHRQYLNDRYVEVYPARPCDLYCEAEELKTTLYVCAPTCLGPHALHQYLAVYRVIEERTVVLHNAVYGTELHCVVSFPDEDTTRAAQQYLKDTLPELHQVEIVTEGRRLQLLSVGPSALQDGNAAESLEDVRPVTPPCMGKRDAQFSPNDRFVHTPYSLDQWADEETNDEKEVVEPSCMWTHNPYTALQSASPPTTPSSTLHSLINSVSRA